jgi:hypothetical protein
MNSCRRNDTRRAIVATGATPPHCERDIFFPNCRTRRIMPLRSLRLLDEAAAVTPQEIFVEARLSTCGGRKRLNVREPPSSKALTKLDRTLRRLTKAPRNLTRCDGCVDGAPTDRPWRTLRRVAATRESEALRTGKKFRRNERVPNRLKSLAVGKSVVSPSPQVRGFAGVGEAAGFVSLRVRFAQLRFASPRLTRSRRAIPR